MKDYYYILGIKETSTADEIKKAYRKLSLKFHPDKNDGDDFFTERFKEIQEAYETLSDTTKRNQYQRARNNSSFSEAPDNGTNFMPNIEYFTSDKSSFDFGEEVTFNWKTKNANKVTINPFGQVELVGQKTYRIKDLKNSKLFFELIAENTNLNIYDRVVLTINNKGYSPKPAEPKIKTKKEIEDDAKRKLEDEKYNRQVKRITTFVLSAIFLLLLFRLFQQLVLK